MSISSIINIMFLRIKELTELLMNFNVLLFQ
jgi:hypothetical protein